MTTTINGATRLFAIVGDPIAQARSPEVYTELFALAGMNAVMVPLHVRPESFAATIPALLALGNLDGLLVTAPYKARMAGFATRLGPTARLIGAVNALRREADGTWTGDMFDGAGFVRGFVKKGGEPAGRHVVLLGAGGAGSAIACELAAAGIAAMAIVDPDDARATSLARTIGRAFPACRVEAVAALPARFDLLVNASTVGMRHGDGLPAAIGVLPASTWVGDVVISAEPTPLVRHAIDHGCAYVSGRDMHAGQIDALMGFLAPGSPLPAAAAL